MPSAPLALRRLTWALMAAGLAQAPAVAQALEPEGRVIVRWKSDAPTVKARALRQQALAQEAADVFQRRADQLGQRAALSLQTGRGIDALTHVVRARGIDSATLAQRLAQDPQVALVAIDHRRRHSRVPNDPIYSNGAGIGPTAGQWYLKPPGTEVRSSINAETAWDTTTGSASVVVAVLDTGVRLDHPDLVANLVPGYDMIGAGGSGSVRLAVANDGDLADPDPSDPGDWVSQADIDGGSLGSGCTSSDLEDSSWHGTKVAGLIAATPNNGIGLAGVGWSTKVQPVRVLGKCGGYDSDILAGMRWAVGVSVPGIPVNANPAKVLNLSLGGSGDCTGSSGPLYTEAIAQATARNAVVVVAAGNSAGEPVDLPANCPGAIAVAGLRHIGSKVGFSSMGPQVAIAAPGGNCVNLGGTCLYPMVTTSNSGRQGPLLSTYTYNEAAVGTSFATPLVAGVAALLYARDPGLTSAQVRNALTSTARPFPTSGSGSDVRACPAPVKGTEVLECYCTTTTCGAGMLDARAAVLAVGAPPPPPPAPTPSPTPSPTPAPATGGGGGGASHPAWLLGLGLAVALLSGRGTRRSKPPTRPAPAPRRG
ncbi:MAG: S8 family peptidase [Inhella sp.]